MIRYGTFPWLFSAIIIISTLATQSASGQEACEDALLEYILSQMEKTSETTKDIKADMRLLIYDAEFEETTERSGFFYLIKKGELMRIVFEKPHPREWYVDEKYFIEYFPDTKYASRWKREKEEKRFRQAKSLSYFGIGTTVKELKKSFEITLLKVEETPEKTRDKKKFVLQLTPKSVEVETLYHKIHISVEVETPYHKIHISVLEGQWLPFEVKGFKESGNTETWIFGQIKINSGLKEKEVRFRPPRGVVVEDEG